MGRGDGCLCVSGGWAGREEEAVSGLPATAPLPPWGGLQGLENSLYFAGAELEGTSCR